MAPSSISSGGFPLSRWQIALALGATGALGLAYWYLKQQQQQSAQQKRDNLAKSKGSVSLDDTAQDDLPDESPLQRAQRLKNEGNVFFKKGKYDEAIGFYNKAIDACPTEQHLDLSTFYQNRAAAYEQLKKWSSVISDCTKALEHNSKYEKALYRRAKAYETTKEWENCLDDITAVCLIQNFQGHNALLMADHVLKELGKLHASEAFKNRKAILPSSQYIKSYFMSFSEDPVYKKLLSTEEPIGEGELKGFLRAKLAFATEHYDDIISACTEEISSEPNARFKMEAHSLRASFNTLCGAHKEAFEDLNFIIDSDESDLLIKVNCLIKRASLHMQLEKTEQSLNDFSTAAELGPHVSDVFHHRGQVNLLLDKVDDARRDFKKAVDLNPNFPIAIVQKCYADYRYFVQTSDNNNTVKTMELFKKTIERFPNCCEVYLLYGQVLTECREYDEADKQFIKAMEVEPKNATILVHRGLLLLQWKGDVDGAVKLIYSAISLDEKCEFAYETLGTIEVQRGNLLIAVELFDKAITFSRNETEMGHLFSLRDAAISQYRVSTKLGIGPHLVAAASS